jgi:adenylate kinase family enzyme
MAVVLPCTSVTGETVLWLNGPFGVGKTTVARLLTERRLVDPENIGFVLRRTFWRGRDYQDVALWRRLVAQQVRLAARRGPVVVPMTIVDRTVLDHLRGALPGMRMVVLDAPRDVIDARAIADTADPAARQWRLDNLDRCVTALADPVFGEHIDATRPAHEIARDLWTS